MLDTRSHSSLAVPLLLALGAAAACTGERGAKREPAPAPLASLTLPSPESVVFDSARDVYYVSVVNGDPGVRPGKGFIARVTADGALDSLHFIQGGRDGVVLDAPMGSRVRGDTLWVVDIDKLRGFTLPAGAPAATIDLAPLAPSFLNENKMLVTFIVSTMVEDMLKNRTLVRLDVPEFRWRADSSVIFRRGVPLPPAAALLLDHVRAVCDEIARR